VGLQLQLALALAGVVWPFVHLPTYERKHAAFQQVRQAATHQLKTQFGSVQLPCLVSAPHA
jgi:hypothetical protein